MECRLCHNIIPDGETYCPYCGGAQYDAGSQGTPQTYSSDTQLLTPGMDYYGYQQGTDQTAGYQQPMDQTAAYAQPLDKKAQKQAEKQAKQYAKAQAKQAKQAKKQASQAQTQGIAEGKKKNGGKGILVAVAVIMGIVVLGAVGWVIYQSVKGDDVDYHLAYLKDNELHGVDMSKSKPSSVMYTEDYYEDRSDSYYLNGYVAFSDDGKYVFFPEKFSSYSSYDLYYRSAEKAKAESHKVDGGISTYRVLSNNKVVYKKDNGALYISDLQEKQKIANDVAYFYISENNNNVLWTERDTEGTYTLYYRPLSLKKEKDKIDSYVSDLWCSDDLKSVVYLKDENLYRVVNFGESEKIASHVEKMFTTGRTSDYLYYLSEESFLDVTDVVYDDVNSEYSREVMANYIDTDDSPLYDLYEYNAKTGKGNKVDDGVILAGYLGYTSVFRYARLDVENIDRIKMSTLLDGTYYYQEEINALLEDSLAYTVMREGNKVGMDWTENTDIEDAVTDKDEKYFYYTVYDDKGKLEIYRMSLGKDFGSKSSVDDDVDTFCGIYGGKLYYLKDVRNDSGDLYCDGKSIMNDVSYCYGMRDSDAVWVAYDTDTNRSSHTIAVYKDGKKTVVAEDVYSVRAYSEKCMALLVDYNIDKHRGDLYFYNGRKKTVIDTDVNSIY